MALLFFLLSHNIKCSTTLGILSVKHWRVQPLQRRCLLKQNQALFTLQLRCSLALIDDWLIRGDVRSGGVNKRGPQRPVLGSVACLPRAGG